MLSTIYEQGEEERDKIEGVLLTFIPSNDNECVETLIDRK